VRYRSIRLRKRIVGSVRVMLVGSGSEPCYPSVSGESLLMLKRVCDSRNSSNF
jgi:hypothetical protein